MLQSFTCVPLTQHNKTHQRIRRTALSLFIGGLFCSAAPVWADCVTEGTNANGGLNITCEGAGSIFGSALLSSSNITNNIVIIQGEGTTVIDGVYISTYTDSNHSDITNSNNSIILNNDSSVRKTLLGYVLNAGSIVTGSDIGNASIIGNSVTLNNNSTAIGSVSAGHFQNNYSMSNYLASGNTVSLNDSASVTGDIHAYSEINSISESSDSYLVTNNSVTLNDNSMVLGSVYSIYSQAASKVSDGEANYKNNSVTLNGSSTVKQDVYATYFGDPLMIGTWDDSVMVHATDNTVNINDTAKVSGSLYGSFVDGPLRYDAFSGNTLNFAAAPITLSGTVANFENYNFTLDPSLANTDTALITANTITFGTNDTNMKGGEDNTSKIKVVGIKAGDELFADDTFVLMKADTMTGEGEGLTTKGVAQQGISLLYDVQTTVNKDGGLVTATIIGKEKPVDPVDPPIDPEKPVEPGKPAAKVNPQLKSLSEGHLASAMMLTRGADTLAYDTINTIKQQNPQKGWSPFISLSGNKTRYNSGSHINAKDALLTGGVSYQQDKFVTGAFIESGWGSYDTYNGFNTMKSVNGDGHSRYVGLGVLGRYDFESGVYVEGSLRGGKNRNTFDTKDIQNIATGERVHYNLDSNYLGAHVGTGYTKALDEKNTLDVSAKYLWTQLKGKDVKIAGDNIHFDDINSHRVRLNTSLVHQYTKSVVLRAGLGYEYEFDGKANASTYGYAIGAPSVQGSTGIMSVGATVTPMDNQAFNIDVNANGYTGQRDGIGGNIKFSYAF